MTFLRFKGDNARTVYLNKIEFCPRMLKNKFSSFNFKTYEYVFLIFFSFSSRPGQNCE